MGTGAVAILVGGVQFPFNGQREIGTVFFMIDLVVFLINIIRCGFPCNLPLGKFQRFILRSFGWDVHSLYPFGGSDALCRDYGLWSALLWVLVDKGDVRGVLGVCRV